MTLPTHLAPPGGTSPRAGTNTPAPASAHAHPGADDAAHMSLVAHLVELRRRLLWAFAGIALATVAGWYLYPLALTHLTAPLAATLAAHAPPTQGLNFRTVLSPFATRLNFAMVAGLVLASPWWITQGWLFIAPGLRRHERRTLLALAVPSVLLFLTGAGLALAFLPRAVALLLGQAPDGVSTLLDTDAYLRFVMLLTLVVGASFLFPVVEVGVCLVGLVHLGTLVRKWRWAVMAAFTFAAITNPLPDLWSMILQAGTLLLLHTMALGVCALVSWARTRRARRAGRR